MSLFYMTFVIQCLKTTSKLGNAGIYLITALFFLLLRIQKFLHIFTIIQLSNFEWPSPLYCVSVEFLGNLQQFLILINFFAALTKRSDKNNFGGRKVYLEFMVSKVSGHGQQTLLLWACANVRTSWEESVVEESHLAHGSQEAERQRQRKRGTMEEIQSKATHPHALLPLRATPDLPTVVIQQSIQIIKSSKGLIHKRINPQPS